MTLHEGEAPIDAALVARLLADQQPDFARLPIQPLQADGTVNVIYRLGDAWCVRLPR